MARQPSMRRPLDPRPVGAALALAAAAAALACGRGPERQGGAASAVVAAPSAAPSAAAPKAAPLLDLLHHSAAEVAVSSNVDNPRDFPEHLIDGRPDTAWNGKTGDLVGGWVAFRLPSGVSVRRVELSAGFDKVSAARDLFAMNHRIRRVRLSRDGRTLVERDLDPSVRAPQAIELPRPGGGGVYRVEVLAVEPGTKAAWRELSVSELKVWGDPGPAKLERPTMPPVGVGDFPRPRPPLPPPPASAGALFARAHSSLGAFCRAYDAALRPAIDATFDGNRYPGKIEGPHCSPGGPLVPHFAPGGWAEALYGYGANDADVDFRSFAVKTPAGVVPAHVKLQSHAHDDPGCFGGSYAEVRQARYDGGRLHLTVLRVAEERLRTATGPGGETVGLPAKAEISKVDVACALEGDALACSETELASACFETFDYRLPAAPGEPDWTHRCAEPPPP